VPRVSAGFSICRHIGRTCLCRVNELTPLRPAVWILFGLLRLTRLCIANFALMFESIDASAARARNQPSRTLLFLMRFEDDCGLCFVQNTARVQIFWVLSDRLTRSWRGRPGIIPAAAPRVPSGFLWFPGGPRAVWVIQIDAKHGVGMIARTARRDVFGTRKMTFPASHEN